MNPRPAALVKRLADGIDDRMLGADVDVLAPLDMLECTPDQYVFEILRIGVQKMLPSRRTQEIPFGAPCPEFDKC